MTRELHYNKADITSLYAQLLRACKLSLFWSEQHVSHRLSRSFSRGSCYANEETSEPWLGWLMASKIVPVSEARPVIEVYAPILDTAPQSSASRGQIIALISLLQQHIMQTGPS